MNTTANFNNEFDNEISTASTIPWLQVINHPKLSAEKAEKLGEPWGIFISAENAEAVEFSADDDWGFVEAEFASGKTPGLIARNLRAVFLHRSDLEVQIKNEKGRWQFVDLAYRRGKITAAGTAAFQDRENYRKVTRNLIYIVGSDNRPLHSVPLQFTTRGAFGASLGVDVAAHYAQFEKVFFKSQNRPVKTINPSGRSRIVYSAAIGVDFAGFETKGLNPALYMAARQCAVTDPANLIVKDVADSMGRPQRLQGVMLSSLFISKDSPFGQQLANDFALYESFPQPRVEESEPDSSVSAPQENVDRALHLDDDMPF